MFKTLKKHLINITAKKNYVCVLCTNIMDFSCVVLVKMVEKVIGSVLDNLFVMPSQYKQ